MPNGVLDSGGCLLRFLRRPTRVSPAADLRSVSDRHVGRVAAQLHDRVRRRAHGVQLPRRSAPNGGVNGGVRDAERVQSNLLHGILSGAP